jgi:hypothetical protein
MQYTEKGVSSMKMRYLLAMITILVILITQASASDKYLIFVRDSLGNYVEDAYVEVWDGSSKVDSGNTDSSGIFTTWLDGSIRYKVTASGNGQSGDWQGLPENNRIDIYMHK